MTKKNNSIAYQEAKRQFLELLQSLKPKDRWHFLMRTASLEDADVAKIVGRKPDSAEYKVNISDFQLLVIHVSQLWKATVGIAQEVKNIWDRAELEQGCLVVKFKEDTLAPLEEINQRIDFLRQHYTSIWQILQNEFDRQYGNTIKFSKFVVKEVESRTGDDEDKQK